MAIATLTPAQKSVQNKMRSLVDKVGEPFYGSDWTQLLQILKEVPPTSGWGIGIKYAFERNYDMNKLAKELASQAVDDPFTMMKIVGYEGTVLLLKYHER